MSTDRNDYQDYPWVTEFRQEYMNGLSVIKRSVDATPMVIRKYDIGPDEVMAFSSYEKRNQALSVFHFHPDFPYDDRHRYMEQHTEGYEVAEEVQTDLRAESDILLVERKNVIKSFGRTIVVTFHAMVLYILTNHPDAR